MSSTKIFTILLFAAVAQSVPLSDVRQKWLNLKQQEPESESESNEIDNTPNYRLPNDSLPIKYDLWLKTDVHVNKLEFSGRVKIHIKIVQPTQLITLHARQLTIDKIDLLSVDNSLSQTNLEHVYDETVEFLKITLPGILNADDEIILSIKYHGTLRDDSSGFYRAGYINIDTGEIVWYATTQFQPTDARHAMPCYDEPGIRAIHSLEIQHDNTYNAISNMPISSRDAIDGTTYVTSRFPDTVSMQSYLLAFIVSDFGWKSNNDLHIEQRVYAAPQLIKRGDGDFALSMVGPILKEMEEHFQVGFPLPKMDHAAITDFMFGAMENFGLITYHEHNILHNKDAPSSLHEKIIIEMVTHEVAHQWFGNIVSPKWWSYTWLNEGFATLYEYYIPSLIFPESDHMERFEKHIMNAAFDADSNPLAKPLNLYVQTPIDIRNKFDFISYRKGGSILRMFQEALTVPTFTKGLSYYINEMYFESATPKDLHRSLQRAFDEDFSDNGINLDEVMSTWEDQAGYPVISVHKREGAFVLKQERFGGGNEVYSIPVTYILQSEANPENKTSMFWFTTSTFELESDDDWIILDIQNTGYFKISYEKSIFEAIVKDLPRSRKIISPSRRTQLFKDTRNQLRDRKIEAYHGLEHLNYLREENHYTVWSEGLELETLLSDHIFGTVVTTKYHKFIQDIINPHIRRLGFEGVKGEPTSDGELRRIVTTLSCKTLQEDCLNYELSRLIAFIDTGTGLYNFCEGIRHANETIFSTLLSKTLKLDHSDVRYNDILSFGCSLDPELITKYLEALIDKSNDINGYTRYGGISSTMTKSITGLEVVLDFIRDNYQEIESILPGQLLNILIAMTSYINTGHHWDQLKEILDQISLTPADVRIINSSVAWNMNWISENLRDIETWLDGDIPSATIPAVDSTPLTTSPSSVDQSTTLGSSSIIASSAIVTASLLTKLFV